LRDRNPRPSNTRLAMVDIGINGNSIVHHIILSTSFCSNIVMSSLESQAPNGPSSPAPCSFPSNFFNGLKKRPDFRKCVQTTFFHSGHSKHSHSTQRSRNIPSLTQLVASSAMGVSGLYHIETPHIYSFHKCSTALGF